MRSSVMSGLLIGPLALCLASPATPQIPGPNVNMVSGTGWPGGDPYLQRQNEPSCAVSTRNPRHLLCGANDYRTVDIPGLPDEKVNGDAWLGLFKSFDAGARWQSTLLPGYPQDVSAAGYASPLRGYQAGADPVVRSGHNGLFYYSGIAFNRGTNALGVSFVARFVDLNNKEGASYDVVANRDPIVHVGTSITDTGTAAQFIDKPWLAVDVPRADARLCRIVVNEKVRRPDGTEAVQPVMQQFPGGRVFQGYSIFVGGDQNLRTKLMLTRSLDCGATWEAPVKLSEGFPINQGTTIAIAPATGNVYVAWRQFATVNQPDAILFVGSRDGGATFTKPIVVATIAPFEQGTSEVSFRTSALPTMTVDSAGRIYLAWSGRDSATGFGRAMLTVSTDGGATWSVPRSAHGTAGLAGHQLMPSLAVVSGKLALSYYGQQFDHQYSVFECPQGQTCHSIAEYTERLVPAGELASIPAETAKVFNRCLIDLAPNDPACNLAMGSSALKRRHTVDVFTAGAELGNVPVFTQPVRVSRYAVGSVYPYTDVRQLQFNPPNLPLFQLGTAAFLGDYVDMAVSPPFVLDAAGRWVSNVDAGPSPLVHLAWTDNRDVRPPPAGKTWADYTPPSVCGGSTPCPASRIDPTQQVPGCDPSTAATRTTAGMRNQNVYTSRLSSGVSVSALQNSKRLGFVDLASYGRVLLQRAFAVVVENPADEVRHFRVSLLPTTDVHAASFLQFQPDVTQLDVSIAARSSIARTVYVTSENPAAAVTVDVARIASIGALDVLDPAAGGISARVVLNPDPTAPDITNPDITNPDITNPDITNAEVYNPDITNPDITNPDITNPDITNPDITNPDITNPDITNPDITNPDITNPDITNPDITNPDITNPDITNPDITNGAIVDATWKIRNRGNTSAVYDVNLLTSGRVPAGFKLQLILHRVYTTPVALGCTLAQETHNVLVASIPNPDITNPDITNPDITNPDITNATLALGPGEEGRITLRILDPNRSDNVNAEDFIRENAVLPVVVPQAVDTVPAADVIYGGAPPVPPAPATPVFTVLTTHLPDGRTGVPYWATLAAAGGKPPYAWSIASGALPPGVSLSAGGLLFGTPTAGGAYVLVVQASDASTPQKTAARALTLSVSSGLSFLVPPTAAAAGAAIAPAVELRLADATDSPIAGATITLSLQSNPTGATLSGGTSADTNGIGIATFAGLTVDKVGGCYTLRASAGPLEAVSPGFNATGFRNGATALTPRALAAVAPLADGRLLMAGGQNTAILSSAELYDTANESFTWTGSLAQARTRARAALLNDGRVLVVGGLSPSDVLLTSAEVYDPAAATFSPAGDLAPGRYAHTATLLARTGRVLVAGGTVSSTGTSVTASAGVWVAANPPRFDPATMTTPRSWHTATALQNGEVLIVGGIDSTTHLASAEVFDRTPGVFTPLPAALNVARASHTATLLRDGRVLIAGGVSGSHETDSAEIYDPATGLFTPTGNMVRGRAGHVATLLKNGQVLVVGGYYDVDLWARTSEVYDPASGTFHAVGDLPAGRVNHVTETLPNADVLVTGGSGPLGALATSLVYVSSDPPFCDGSFPARVVFQSDRDGDNEIYVSSGFGSPAVQLTNNTASDETPSWSPDGSKIAFSSDRAGGRNDIWVMSADGSGAANLTPSPATYENAPVWAPDGRQIAFVRSVAPGNRDVFVMSADGSGQQNLTNSAADDYHPAWSPDGTRIAFTSNRSGTNQLYIMNANGSSPAQVGGAGEGVGPAWSPDGSKIAFTRGDPAGYRVWLLDVATNATTQVTLDSAIEYNFDWSPDGRWLVMERYPTPRNSGELYVVRSDGTQLTPFYESPSDERWPRWRPVP